MDVLLLEMAHTAHSPCEQSNKESGHGAYSIDNVETEREQEKHKKERSVRANK